MKIYRLLGLAALALPLSLQANPEAERKVFQDYYIKKFSSVDYQDFGNGAYALDEVARANWEAIEEFPPYEIVLEDGQQLFETPFKNGKTYADCFPNGGIGIKQNYPYFDAASAQVRTLEQDINACREKNAEKPYKWKKGKLAAIGAYMAYTSRGNKINVMIPDDPKALAAYEAGKKFFYSKRGQLNFACADCHIGSSGSRIRSEVLSTALGQVSHFPVYRAKWGEMGTLHRRYAGCNKQVRAKPFKPQSEQYRNLEYFHTYMSNGIEINGPGARK
ncbi:sulfur oxidation c-type cytochrome SoxA [Candidatus Venteria ishoeyi]|uniref:SoxAX cytochrome complex subunit A n=1 Tax=Candidatus Venteria ishoeyi TaxID=1899563 RepID=A0A1H6FEJ2_9GAMM|nr:sulfur oxidation c-type cytochrome SoxA [Candidatus Venteria ishoeyi]MDM8546451.1 sulfur oxidation c-type cytochrome SoxA [Candidatus Venteria ishoeyi]SEH08482.1 SoxAX cytochrome complex subunit A precursor [Candidatus Venteria ishoeyi]